MAMCPVRVQLETKVGNATRNSAKTKMNTVVPSKYGSQSDEEFSTMLAFLASEFAHGQIIEPSLRQAQKQGYVIYHELCHLQEHNHSPEYCRLLESVMPDLALHKQILDSLADVLLNR